MKTYHFITLLILLLTECASAQGTKYTAVPPAEAGSTIAAFKFSRLEKSKEGNIKAELNKVLIQGGSFYFKLRLSNRSPIPYDIDFIRFYIRDLKSAKRTVTQEQEVYPTVVLGKDVLAIAPMERQIKVFRLDKFTVPDDKALYIEIYEKNGARHLGLKVSRTDIENALTLK